MTKEEKFNKLIDMMKKLYKLNKIDDKTLEELYISFKFVLMLAEEEGKENE